MFRAMLSLPLMLKISLTPQPKPASLPAWNFNQ